MGGVVFLNGAWLPAGEARVGIGDQGFLYGAGLFETMRVAGGRVPLLDRHLERLARGAGVLGIALPLSAGALRQVIAEAVRRNRLEEGALRLTVTGGPAGGGLGRAGEWDEHGATLLVTVRAGRPYPDELYGRGFTAVWARARRNHLSPLCRVKSLNYLDSLLARREARAAGADEALFLNGEGKLAEGAATNVFFVAGGRLCTPSPEAGALPGVARGLVLELARGAGIETEEGAYDPDALLAAEEAFLTNALMGVMPLAAVAGRPIGHGGPGPVTRRLQDLFEGWMRFGDMIS